MSTNLNKQLGAAVRNGSTEDVKRLLASGASAKANDSWALQAAAESGHLEIVKLLLPFVDPMESASWALRRAAANNHVAVVKLLLPVSDAQAGNSWALRWSACRGWLEVVRILLPVSAPAANNYESIKLAAQHEHLDIVKLLLPFSPITEILTDTLFIEGSGCDLLLSCLPILLAKDFIVSHPRMDLPRTRAMLAAKSLLARRSSNQPSLHPRLRS